MDIDAKLRPLYLLRILKEQSDENHKLTTAQLCKQLKDEYGIETFRTTIKTDIEVLQQAGYTIEATRSSQNQYCYIEKGYDSRELKAILDAVLSSPVMTNEVREQVETKLKKLRGPFNASELRRNWVNVSCVDRSIPMEDILDVVNEAINKGRKIRFREFAYNVKRERVAINDGKPLTISPYYLTVNGNNTYVIGFSHDTARYCIHRVDRICDKPEILDTPAEPMKTEFAKRALGIPFDIDCTDPTEVEIQVDNSMMGEVLDKFGPGVTTYACDQNSFRVVASVGIGPAFYQWIFSLEGKAKVRKPKSVCEEYKAMVRKAASVIE